MENGIVLSKEVKILLIRILKSGKLTQEDADVLLDFMQTGDLFQRVQIKFKDFSKESEK